MTDQPSAADRAAAEEIEQFERDHDHVSADFTAPIIAQRMAEERKRAQRVRIDTLNECIKVVMNGRTMVNFSHVPSVVRALEWVWMDLGGLVKEAEARAALEKP